MRVLKIGRIKTKGILGIRVLIIDIVNPFKQIAEALEPILWLRRIGYLRSLRLPGIKIQWLKTKNHNQSVQATANSRRA